MATFFKENWWLLVLLVCSFIPLAMRVVKFGAMETFSRLDRRWIFLMMLWAVVIPVHHIGRTKQTFPERALALAESVFHEIDKLEEGDKVLLAFDFDPASEGELGPMATAFTYHCIQKKLKMYFLALWPLGRQMTDDTINTIIKPDFPHLQYGIDYINLGFKSGNEGVIKVIVTDLRQLYTTDAYGSDIGSIPMMQGVNSVQDVDLLVNVSAGYPGTKEWVQYAVTPYPDEIRMVGGCTGVQAPLLYPYIPQQLPGLLAAIKGASEYEKLVLDAYPPQGSVGKYMEAQRRMGPQLIAHVLMVLLIIGGNVIFFVGRKREAHS
jgi:hypothetical protein